MIEKYKKFNNFLTKKYYKSILALYVFITIFIQISDDFLYHICVEVFYGYIAGLILIDGYEHITDETIMEESNERMVWK